MLRIHLFGQLRVFLDDEPVDVAARPKVESLLAYLLLQRNQVISRDTAAFALWPDVPETDARANLRRHLHALNRALPSLHPSCESWILRDHQTIQWNPQANYWLDVAEFEQQSRTEATLAAAVQLYTGDLLENLYEDWLFYERERLRDLYFALLTRLTTGYRVQGNFTEALYYGQEILRRDPLREDAVRQLMAIFQESGNRAGALTTYERFARHLAEELAVEPMPETVDLYQRIKRNLPATEPQQAPPSTGPKPRDLLPFVGHQTELEQLHTAWGRTAQGRSSLVLVGGEAGIGKTRLLNELINTIDPEEGRVLGGATTFTEPMPYQAIVQALQSALPLLAALDISDLWLAALQPILPGLQARLTRPADVPRLDVERERDRLFEAIAHSLIGLAQPRPVLLVLEDFHWASTSSVLLLEFLARRLAEHPVLLVVTYREEETPRRHPLREMRRRLQRQQRIDHLTLSRFSADTVTELVSQMAGTDNAVDPLSPLLYARSEGNPLFIHELLYDWIEAGQIEITGGRWQIKDLNNDQIPGRVSDIIRQRLGRINEDALALAEIAAVIGPNFDLDVVRETGGWDEGTALAALDELLDHYLVRERSKGSRFDFTFTHQLTQATLYADIPANVRRRRHRRIGQVLADLHGDRLDEMAGYLAHHFEQGDLPEEAAHYYWQAAQRALTLFADDEALEFLTRGLTLTIQPRLRWDLLLLRESIYHRQGQREQQQTELAQLAKVADTLNDNECYCELLMHQIGLQHALGQRDEEVALIEQLKDHAVCLDDSNWQANALRVEAIYLLSIGDYDRARELLQQALDQYRSLHNHRGEIKCYCMLAQLATERGHLNEVIPLVQQARNLAEAEANYLLLFRVIYVAAHAAFVQKDYKTCQELCQQALDLCQQTGYLEGEADTHKLLGSVANRLFDIPQSFRHYNRAKTLYARLDKVQGQAAVLMNMGILSVSLGRYEEGGEAFAQAWQLFEQLQDVRGQMLSTLNLSAAALYQEDYPAAKSAAQASLDLARQLQTVHIEANALGNLGEAERELGEFDQALIHLQTALDLRRSMDTQPVDAVNDLCQLALTYLRQNNLKAAQQTCAELLAILQVDEPSILYPQLVLWVSAQTYYALGDTTQAREYLQTAYARLQTKLAAIPDDETRQTYSQLRFNREVLTAYNNGSWPD